MSRTNRLSRIPSNRTCLVVRDVELLAASVSRPTTAVVRAKKCIENDLSISARQG
jgi:hypothetical protein